MKTPSWMPDERAYAGPEHLNSAYVPGYDEKAQTDPSDDVAVLRDYGLDRTQTVVDLGSGTGTFALAIAPYCKQVTAVDVSEPMLDVLRRRIVRDGVDNITVVPAGFLSYQHPGPAADAVYSRNALHHLPDFWKVVALERIAAMLRPGGIFRLRDLVYDFKPGEESAVFGRWLDNAVTDAAMGWTREELETHIREEFSTFTWLLEPMLERTGFRIADATHRGTYSAYTCVRND